MSRLTFDELRETLHQTNEGQVLDSFIAVEIGLDDYSACWDAHNDVYENMGVTADDQSVITLFLQELYDMLDVREEIFERVLGANL